MKIGIITFHFPYNCGAVLQVFALQRILENMGHEVCVINYCPKYHKNLYTPIRNPFISAKKVYNSKNNFLKNILPCAKAFAATIYSWRNYKGMKQADVLFKGFINTYLNLTKEYKTLSELQKTPPDCDMYISGSDQLWNSALTGNGFDEAYFLNFGNKEIRRITYAVSTRINQENDQELESLLGKLISNLDAISLRELNNIDLISKIAKQTLVCQTIDPTLLLNAESYDDIISKDFSEQEPFILTYCITTATQRIVMNIANRLQKQTGIRIINTLCYPKKSGKKTSNIRICSPESFLWHIKNAQYIVTDSFHGTVFAILFGKKFVTVPRGKNDTRVKDLLTRLGIKGHLTTNQDEALTEVIKEIDYAKVNTALTEIRKTSLDYLQSNIKGCQNKTLSKDIPNLCGNKENCCGCSACIESCPVNAITMKIDNEGFEYPFIQEEKCIKCNTCLSVCAFKKDQTKKGFLQ